MSGIMPPGGAQQKQSVDLTGRRVDLVAIHAISDTNTPIIKLQIDARQGELVGAHGGVNLVNDLSQPQHTDLGHVAKLDAQTGAAMREQGQTLHTDMRPDERGIARSAPPGLGEYQVAMTGFSAELRPNAEGTGYEVVPGSVQAPSRELTASQMLQQEANDPSLRSPEAPSAQRDVGKIAQPSSQAGLGAHQGGSHVRVLPGVPKPGEPGSRFNPVRRDQPMAERGQPEPVAGSEMRLRSQEPARSQAVSGIVSSRQASARMPVVRAKRSLDMYPDPATVGRDGADVTQEARPTRDAGTKSGPRTPEAPATQAPNFMNVAQEAVSEAEQEEKPSLTKSFVNGAAKGVQGNLAAQAQQAGPRQLSDEEWYAKHPELNPEVSEEKWAQPEDAPETYRGREL